MFEERSEQLRRVMTLLDLSITIIVFLTAAWLRTLVLDDDPSDLLSHIAFLPFILALWMLFLALFGAYQSPRSTSLLGYTWAVTQAMVAGLACLFTILFVMK